MQYTLIYVICIVLTLCKSMPCDSCGKECTTACGTKHFRTCCFNYLRKRSEVKTIKTFSNKKLASFLTLQENLMFAHNVISKIHPHIIFKNSNI